MNLSIRIPRIIDYLEEQLSRREYQEYQAIPGHNSSIKAQLEAVLIIRSGIAVVLIQIQIGVLIQIQIGEDGIFRRHI